MRTKHHWRKILTVCLSLVMIMTMWVFVAPTTKAASNSASIRQACVEGGRFRNDQTLSLVNVDSGTQLDYGYAGLSVMYTSGAEYRRSWQAQKGLYNVSTATLNVDPYTHSNVFDYGMQIKLYMGNMTACDGNKVRWGVQLWPKPDNGPTYGVLGNNYSSVTVTSTKGSNYTYTLVNSAGTPVSGCETSGGNWTVDATNVPESSYGPYYWYLSGPCPAAGESVTLRVIAMSDTVAPSNQHQVLTEWIDLTINGECHHNTGWTVHDADNVSYYTCDTCGERINSPKSITATTPLPTTAGSTLENGKIYTVASNTTITAGANQNGLVVQDGATVILSIPTGVTLNVTGGAGSDGTIGSKGDASSNTRSSVGSAGKGGRAGIYVPPTSTLIITGGGKLTAVGGKGGNAARGTDGANGYLTTSGDGYYKGGPGGSGGGGAGGGGAGIGGNGGNGGSGGQGGTIDGGQSCNLNNDGGGGGGANGSAGGNGTTCGTVLVTSGTTVTATGGSKGSQASGGSGGSAACDHGSGWTNNYSAGGGGGGGGGGAGSNGAAVGGGGYGGGGAGGGGTGGHYSKNKFSDHVSRVGLGGSGGNDSGTGGSNGGSDGHSTNGNINGGSGAGHGSAGGNGNYQTNIPKTDARVTEIRQFAFLNTQLTPPTATVQPVYLGGTMPKITPPTRDGYTFNGYYSGFNGVGTKYYNADGTSAHIVDFLTGELYAYWTIIEYPISYTLNGGAVSSANPTSYTIETDNFTLNNPTKEGYTFRGWSGTGLTGDANKTVTVAKGSTGDRSYTANWDINKYAVTVTPGTGTTITGATTGDYDHGTRLTVSAAAQEGYDQSTPTLYVNGSQVTNPYTFTVTGPTTISTDPLTLNTYTVTFYYGDGLTSTVSKTHGATLLPGEIPTDTAKASTPSTDYTFTGWDRDLDTPITANTVINAQYSEATRQYTVNFVGENDELIETRTLDYGAEILVPAAPAKEDTAQYAYSFDGWYNGTTKLESGTTVTGEVTYKAKFTSTLRSYTVAFQNEDGTPISSATLNYGETIVPPADPTKESTVDHTYAFAGWYNGEERFEDGTTVTGEVTYKARFTENDRSYTVTFIDGAISTLKTVVYGGIVTPPEFLKETDEDGHVYTRVWQGSQDVTAPITGDVTFTAVYTFEHTFGEVIPEKASTCHTQGNVAYKVCSVCSKLFTPDGEVLSEVLKPLDPTNHEYTEWSKVSDANCISPEVWTRSCPYHEDATQTENRGEIDPNHHVHTHETEAVSANCVTEGFTAGVYCDDCHKYVSGHVSQGYDTTEAGHVYGGWASNGDGTHSKVCSRCAEGTKNHTVTENCSGGEATCITKAVCGICNTEYGEVNAGNHKNTRETEAVTANCVTEGFTAGVYCDDCHKYVSGHVTQGYDYSEAGHVYGGWASNGNGTHSKVCSRCAEDTENHTVTEDCSGGEATCITKAVCGVCGTAYGEVNADNHKNTRETEAVTANCITEGFTAGVYCDDCHKYVSGHVSQGYDYSEAGHVYGGWASNGDDTHSKVCSRCAEDTENHTVTENCSGGEATCTALAVCAVCHEAYGKMLDHQWEWTTDKAPTCSSTGLKHEECAVCHQKQNENTVIPTLEHAWNGGAYIVQPTCTEGGSMVYTCTRCGEKKYETVDALGHEIVDDYAVEPTCTERGITAGTHCARCGRVLTPQIVVSELGHDYGEWGNRVEPTCTDAGHEERTCARCGYVDVREIPANGHQWGAWSVTTPAKCTEKGIETAECTVCHVTKTRDVPATGHKWISGEGTTATCTEAGTAVWVCANGCGETKTENVAALGHDWSAWEVVTPATAMANGIERRTCARCGETAEREIAYGKNKDRNIQFVAAPGVAITVHAGPSDVVIRDQSSRAIPWYAYEDLRFEVTKTSSWSAEGYTVLVNRQILAPDADGGYTIPGGKDYAIVSVELILNDTPATPGGSGSSGSGVCKLCGQNHGSSFWGRIVAFFHAIIYFFKHLFGG